MKRCLFLPLAALALTAAAPAPDAAIDATLKRAYGGYLKESGPAGGDWDQPVFTASTRRLIRQWQAHNGGELTGLNSYGWLCECQDWQWQKFAWKRASLRQIAPGKMEATVRVNPGWGDFVTQRLVLVREGKVWLIDDLFSKSEPKGVKAAMRRELLETPGE